MRAIVLLAALLATALGLTTLTGGTHAALTGESAARENRVATAPDWTAPRVQRTVLVPAVGSPVNTISGGQTYHVYADLADSGNPSSGVAAISADVAAVTTGATTVALAAGSWTVDGQTYSHRSDALAARSDLADGTVSYSIMAVDAAANQSTSTHSAATAAYVPPQFAGARAASTGGAVSASTLTIERPPVQPGYLLGAAVTRTDGDVAIAPPAEWLTYATIVDGNLRTTLYYKTAGGSEPSAYTFAASSPTRIAGGIMSFTTVISSDDVVNRVEPSATDVDAHTTGSLVVAAPSRLLSVFSTRQTATALGWDAGGTEIFDVATSYEGGANASVAAFDAGVVPAGAHQRTGTAQTASSEATMTLIGLR